MKFIKPPHSNAIITNVLPTSSTILAFIELNFRSLSPMLIYTPSISHTPNYYYETTISLEVPYLGGYSTTTSTITSTQYSTSPLPTLLQNCTNPVNATTTVVVAILVFGTSAVFD